MITRLRDVLDPESGLQNLWPDTVSRMLYRILFLFKSLKWLTWVNFGQKKLNFGFQGCEIWISITLLKLQIRLIDVIIIEKQFMVTSSSVKGKNVIARIDQV